MVGYPTYVPLIISLYRLSTWKDANRSAGYCALYFLLWLYDLLPAALVGRILYSLLRRRFLPYPTAEDLRKRRRRVAETEALGTTMDQFSGSWLAVAPVLAGQNVSFGDAFKTFRNVSKAKKANLKNRAAEAVSEAAKDVPLEEQSKIQKQALKQAKEDLRRRQQEEDWKLAIVWFVEGLADIHERVRNIFLWRREEASKRYAFVRAITFL